MIPTQQSPAEFRFEVARASIVRSVLLGVLLFALLPVWGWWSGRMRNIDATYIAIIGSVSIAAALWVGWRTVRANETAAATMGTIAVDARGFRWCTSDGNLALEAAWEAVTTATIDRRLRHILFTRNDAPPVLLGYGSGFIGIERFEQFEQALQAHVTVQPHTGETDRPAAARLIALGSVGIALAIGIYSLAPVFNSVFGWRRHIAATPIALGAVAFIIVMAGVRIGLGRGPLVSPLYASGYWKSVARFYVVLTLAHVVLLAVYNGMGT